MEKNTAIFCSTKHASRLKLLIINYALLITLSACGISKQIAKEAKQTVLADSLLAMAHIGICVYDATDSKYLYNYQGNKYFIPASNTKIATCYAAMKYLGDSLVGLRYRETDSSVNIFPAGDPTLLHPDFSNQPAFDFIKSKNKKIINGAVNFMEEPYGRGWSWDDYNDDYMVERSALPVYGNIAKFHLLKSSFDKSKLPIAPHYFFQAAPKYFEKDIHLSSDSEWIVYRGQYATYSPSFIKLQRRWDSNAFFISRAEESLLDATIPFSTGEENIAANLLSDTLHKEIEANNSMLYFDEYNSVHIIHSQPTDSLLKIMMHRSDNFYAEQSLLMVGNEHIGVMNDAKIIDTLLATDYAAMPQRPQWVDGSGLSRYNLFTPQDFVFILNKMRNEFSWNRITTIFSTGGDGTLGSYYKGLKGKIFAKTGSLTNDIALSGYLITQKNKTLIFSVLVNNHTVNPTSVRKAVERFLTTVQQDN